MGHHPETKSLINQDDLCFGTVDVWLLFNLTKGETYATDVTNASRTMLFNIHNLKFDSDLCQLFNIPIHLLPEVKQSADHYGIVEFDDCPIPIKGVIGDQQAALYSQCGQDKGKIKNTYGTGCFIMANTGSQIVTTNQLVSTIAIGANNHVDYAIEGSIFTGGSLIQWLRDNLNIIDHVEESETLAKSIPSSDGVTLIPALTGLGAPYWRPEVTGTITGLTHKTTRAHLVRAALESIALQSHDIITIIRQELPTMSFDSLFVDGGASQNNWLMQLQADISKLTVVRAPDIEATALGAAMCAGIADNFFNFRPLLQRHLSH